MTQNIVGLFNSFTEANGAKQMLVKQGIAATNIVMRAHEGDTPEDNPMSVTATSTRSHAEGGFMEGIENFFSDLFGNSDNESAGHFAEAVRRGGAVVTVTVEDEAQTDSVRSALTSAGAVNIDERVAAWRDTGYTGYKKASPAYTSDQIAEERSRIIPVIQENLEVGKRKVDLGSVRVVSRVVETPVSESVTLREEHATIERRPVDRPALPEDLAGLQNQSIEVRQTAEKSVVSKTAHVVEEVVVGKESTTHTEQIADKVRSTVVDVERGDVSENADITRITGTLGTKNDPKNKS